MTMVASRMGTVPTEGFQWYLVLLEGPFADAIREQIDKYFITPGKEAGPDVLVVRGYDATTFRNSFIESSAFYGPEDRKGVDVPAIVVTDALPTAVELRNGLDQAKVMIFPLRQIYEEHKDVSIFFWKLLAALQLTEASNALEKLDKAKIEKYWSWFTEYAEFKPGSFGLKADLGKTIGDLLAKARRVLNPAEPTKGRRRCSTTRWTGRTNSCVFGYRRRRTRRRPVIVGDKANSQEPDHAHTRHHLGPPDCRICDGNGIRCPMERPQCRSCDRSVLRKQHRLEQALHRASRCRNHPQGDNRSQEA